MARPKKDPDSTSAQERIETAFIDLLDETGYSGITIGKLASRAKVNHNTIYYYYPNIDALAGSVLRRLLLPQQAVRMFAAGDDANKVISELLSSEDIKKRVHVMQLYASSDSSFLQSILKKSMILEALNYTSLKEEDLSAADKLTLEFILSGFVSMIGQPEVRDNFAAIMAFQNTGFGAHCREAISRILKLQ